MKAFAPINISVLTIFVVIIGTFIGFANAGENVFCSGDAEALFVSILKGESLIMLTFEGQLLAVVIVLLIL
jgi:hypothetical protein